MTDHRALITVEQGAMLGFGGLVLHHLAASGQLDGRCAVRTLHLPDRFIDQASPADMYADAGLTAGDIAAPRWRRWASHPCVIMERQGARLTRRGLPNGNGALEGAPFSIQGRMKIRRAWFRRSTARDPAGRSAAMA
jgi:hypothetical protein